MRALLSLGVLLVSACNSAPGPVEILLEPSEPHVGDDLVVVIVSESVDSDEKDSVTYGYSWFQDGAPRTNLNTNTVDSGETTKNEVWKVIVVPTDGDLDGPPIASEVMVLNTPPTIDELSVDNATPLTTDNVVGTAIASDADGDEVELTYVWTEAGGEKKIESAELTSTDTSHAEVWTLTVTPKDDEEEGVSEVLSVSIGNTEPVVTSVSITPDTAFADSVLTAVVEATDDDPEDAGSLSYTYEWAVDGNVIVGEESDTLSGWFDKHELVTVSVSAFDGFAHGDVVTSDALEISNTVPAFTAVALDPTEIFEATAVTCSPSGWADVDGDQEGYVYAWLVGGQSIPSTSASIDGSQFDRGDTVACSAQAYDGEDFGNTLESGVLDVGNTAPSISSVSLSSTSPQESFTLTASIQGADDVDGDAITYFYEWVVEDTSANQAFFSTETLSGTDFSRGDSIYVLVTPSDGDKDGIAVQSDTAVVVNTAPVIGTVSIDPATLYTDTVADAVVDSVSDEDGDSPTESYEWFVDGTPVATTATLDGASFFDKGNEVHVSASVDDGYGGVASTNSTIVTVANTAPGAPTISVTPDGAEPGEDDLECSVDIDAYDADSDFVTYGFEWDLDGGSYSGTPVETATTSTIAKSELDYEQTWTCTVTPDDGEVGGPAAADSITTDGGCGSLLFDGSTYVEISDHPDLDMTDTLSMAVWVNASSLTSSSGSPAVISKGRSSGGTGYGLRTGGGQPQTYGYPNIGLNDGSGNNGGGSSSSAITTGTWYHIAGTWDGNTANIYLNGILTGSETWPSFGSLTDSSIPLLLGKESTGLSWFYEGLMSNAAVWDSVLTGAQVAELATGTDPSDVGAPVGAWGLNAGSGDTVADTTGNGHSGTIYGGAWSTSCPTEDLDTDGYAAWEDCDDTDATVWGGSSPCTICSSLSFQPVSYVDVGTDTALMQPNPIMTVETWAKWDGTWGGGGNYAQVVYSTLGSGTSGGWNLSVENGNPAYWHVGMRTTSGGDGLGSGIAAFETGAEQWTHIAVVIEDTGTTTEQDVFINGTLVGSNSISGSPYFTGVERFIIGNQDDSYGSNRQFTGEISGIRISSTARYTSDFTPDASLRADSDTIALWEFDEGSGSSTTDNSANGFDGTLSNTSWSTSCPNEDADGDGYAVWEDCDDTDGTVWGGSSPCPSCNSLEFDENVYVSIPDANELDLLYSEYTLEAWVYASGLGFYACPYEGAANMIVSKRLSAGYQFEVMNCVSNPAVLRYNENNDGSYFEGTDTLSEGGWHHVAVSVTGGQAYLWLDGQLQDTGSASSTADTTSPLTIGRDSVTTTHGPYPWRGHIRDVRISDTARYLSGFTPGDLSVDTDTVGFWAIDEGSGSTITDSSGNGNHGAVIGTPQWQPVCHDQDTYVSCLEILNSGASTGDGLYSIDPDGSGAFSVYCDMSTDGGGWTWIGVGLHSDGVTFGEWLTDSAYNSSSSGTSTSSWHMSADQVNGLASAGEFRVGCSTSSNSYYWSGVSGHSWTSTTSAASANTQYNQSGTDYATTWQNTCHWGLVAIGQVTTAHCDNGDGGVVNPWACGGGHSTDISMWAR